MTTQLSFAQMAWLEGQGAELPADAGASFVRARPAIHRGTAFLQQLIQLHIEKLPEGGYLATSDEVQGLVADGRTIHETIEIARDIAEKLIEAQSGPTSPSFSPASEVFDDPMIVSIGHGSTGWFPLPRHRQTAEVAWLGV